MKTLDLRLTALLLVALVSPPPARAFARAEAQNSVDRRIEKMLREGAERAAKDMKSKDAAKRLSAVQSLSSSNGPVGLALLIQGLGDVDERVRAESARSVGTYGKEAEPARAALLNALDDPRPSVVSQAAEALERALKVTEKELGPARTRVLEEGDTTGRFLAARSLVKQAPAFKLVDPILDYIEEQLPGLSSSDYKTRDASRNNVEIGDQALQRLVKETRDRSLIKGLTIAAREFRGRNEVPLKALSLFEPRPENWARLLTDKLETRDPDMRRAILSLMGSTALSASDVAIWAPAAARLEKDTDPWVRRGVISALASAGGLASEQIDVPLRALTDEKDADVREEAAEAIGDIGDRAQATPAALKKLVADRATPALKLAMEKDQDAKVRDKAARALARLQTVQTAGGNPRTAPSTLSPSSTRATAPAAPRGAAAVDPDVEAKALSFLRSKQLKFDTNSFFGALTERDPAVVQAYLDAGTNPNERASEDGDSPLAFFLRMGACSPAERPTPGPVKEVLKSLLAKGADAKPADAHGNTVLMAAAMGGCDREIMALLLRAGSKIDAKNSAGLTAFEMGLFSGHDGLEELIAAGYRLPPDKAALFRQGYAKNPKSLALIDKAVGPAKK